MIAYAELAASEGWSLFNINDRQGSEMIERYVCVIGGGASGVYAAISLIDLNQAVVVVERNDFLGGQTHTYTDPDTDMPIDIGVVVFQSFSVVYKVFGKFDLPLLNMSAVPPNEPGSRRTNRYQLICTAQSDETSIPGTGRTSPSKAMAEVLSNYAVPSRRVRPPGSGARGPLHAVRRLPGKIRPHRGVPDGLPDFVGDGRPARHVDHLPTPSSTSTYLGDFQALAQGHLAYARGNNSELYAKAGDYIGESNVLLESNVVATNRKNTTNNK